MDYLVDGVYRISRMVAGEQIQVGDRVLTPFVEYIFYFKQMGTRRGMASVFVVVFVKPVSFQVSEGGAEWVVSLRE